MLATLHWTDRLVPLPSSLMLPAVQSLVLASRESLSYLDGSLPGDMGFDPLGLFAPDNQVGRCPGNSAGQAGQHSAMLSSMSYSRVCSRDPEQYQPMPPCIAQDDYGLGPAPVD